MQEKAREKARERAPGRLAVTRTGASDRRKLQVTWNDSEMKTSYANVFNVTGTREEVTLLFGIHQNWRGVQGEVSVRLNDRIILNPYAAKRLARLLAGVLAEYDRRFEPLGMDVPEGRVH